MLFQAAQSSAQAAHNLNTDADSGDLQKVNSWKYQHPMLCVIRLNIVVFAGHQFLCMRYIHQRACTTCGRSNAFDSRCCYLLLQTDDKTSAEAPSAAMAIAQEMGEQESRIKSSWTFDYLLKAEASAFIRCLSIVEVKRL